MNIVAIYFVIKSETNHLSLTQTVFISTLVMINIHTHTKRERESEESEPKLWLLQNRP